MCTALDWAILIEKLFRRSTERYAKNIVKLLPCSNFYIDTVWNDLKIVALCLELF